MLSFLLVAGCAAGVRPANPSLREAPSMVGGPAPNWPEIDRTVERIKARERSKPRLVETARVVEHGFFPMSDEDYAAALEVARVDVRKENPKLADSEVEAEAIKRADEAKRRYENSFSSRASSTYEWKVP